jgi:twinkle protein
VNEQTQPLVIVAHKDHEAIARHLGYRHVEVINPVYGAQQAMGDDGQLRIGWEFSRYLIAFPPKAEGLRDEFAVRLGDDKCTWAEWPLGADKTEISNALLTARPMWTDEIAGIDDIPDPGPETTYISRFAEFDEHGFRFVLPAFMPIIGPYASGKSVLLRQLLINLWRQHGWRFLLTSFEEKVKPRYHRDFRRHLIGKPQMDRDGVVMWSDEEVARAHIELQKAAKFLRRPRKAVLDLDRLLNRIDFAVRVHGIKVVAIDPVNEVDHQVPKGESKTDYMGKFIMALKALADDYGLLMICCAHPPKDGVEKRLSRGRLLTLNDGADTAHWGNKADIGWCVWRPMIDDSSPTYLHCDKLKDHESMGKPFLAELHLDPPTNTFRVNRMGYHLLQENQE